jgi:hypothetical protein
MTAPLIGVVGYAMGAITMYTVVLPYIKPILPWLTLPLFFLVLVGVGTVVLMLFYKFVYPSYYAFLNKQVYIHENPMQADLALIKKNQDTIMANQNKVIALIQSTNDTKNNRI